MASSWKGDDGTVLASSLFTYYFLYEQKCFEYEVELIE